MQENSLSAVPRDSMLNELENAQLLGGMQPNDQSNPSQFQDAAIYPYQPTDEFSFAFSPILDSNPFGFLGADESEGFNNYVGNCESLEGARGTPQNFLGGCELTKIAEGAQNHVLGGCELTKIVEGAQNHVLGGCESLDAVNRPHNHVVGGCGSSKVVNGPHNHVSGDCEMLTVGGGSREHVLGNCESLKVVGGAHHHLDAGIAVQNISGQEPNWSDKMLKILIASVSYVEEKHKLSYTLKSNWEAISAVMVERGYFVTPQQCQDKFKSLKYNYERCWAILGRDAGFVIKNPILLESMNLPDEAKMEVRNIIYSKQLCFEEMWSCLNGNRTFLPLDFALIRSLATALQTKVLPESEMPSQGPSVKRKKPSVNRRGKSLAGPSNANNALSGERAKTNQELLKLQDQKAKLLEKKLAFEKEKHEWRKANENMEWEMKQMKLQNEFLKLENERLALKLQAQNLVP